MLKESNYFEHLKLNLNGKVIFLDIDGTLLPSSANTINDNVVDKVRELAKNNRVFLTTNTWHRGRAELLAQALGVPLIKANRRKPFFTARGNVPISPNNEVVIGDKYLTDYLFARNIKATPIIVRRKTSKDDGLLTKIEFFVDYLSSLLIKKIL